MAKVSDSLYEIMGDLQYGGLRWSKFEMVVDFSDLGSGASDAIPLADFPTNVWTLGIGYVEVISAAAGEADLAFIIGDTNDDNGYCASVNLNAATGRLYAAGAELALRYEADFETAGGDITFSATELDDVTAGRWRVVIPYATLPTG